MNPLMWLFFFRGQWRQFCFFENWECWEFWEPSVIFFIRTFCSNSLASRDIFSLTKYVTSSLKDYFILSINVWCFRLKRQIFLCNRTKALWPGSWSLYFCLTCVFLAYILWFFHVLYLLILSSSVKCSFCLFNFFGVGQSVLEVWLVLSLLFLWPHPYLDTLCVQHLDANPLSKNGNNISALKSSKNPCGLSSCFLFLFEVLKCLFSEFGAIFIPLYIIAVFDYFLLVWITFLSWHIVKWCSFLGQPYSITSRK